MYKNINFRPVSQHSSTIRSSCDNSGTVLLLSIKHYLKMFAELASATLKHVADWFVWLASTLGRFNANELRRADHEVHDIADGRYDGRIEKYQQGMSR